MPEASVPEASRPPDRVADDSELTGSETIRGMKSWVTVGSGDIDRMVGRLFLDVGHRSRNLSAFWVLLFLSAVIATAGVVADSTATVIGAMIVAPLMTPILGTALGVVLADRRRIRASLIMVLLGAAAVITIAFLFGLTVQGEVVASNNSQVASRVSPRLVDLIAALATGLVGAFALLRSDVSDTLPGVAIAISLVPPLAVVGLTLESGAPDQALGALLLFGTNVAAIIATGMALLLYANVRAAAHASAVPVGALGAKAVLSVAVALVAVALPLGVGSWHVIQEQRLIAQAKPVAEKWAKEQGWSLTQVSVRRGELQVSALGLPPKASDKALRAALDEAGLGDVEVSVTLVLGGTRQLRSGP